jgi:hypothetical protein
MTLPADTAIFSLRTEQLPSVLYLPVVLVVVYDPESKQFTLLLFYEKRTSQIFERPVSWIQRQGSCT